MRSERAALNDRLAPPDTAARMQPQLPYAPLPAEMRQRILLVDDDPHVLSALRRALRGQGYELLTAPCGEDALALFGSQPFDAIVCDMRMPGVSGAEVLRACKSMDPGTVRVLLTGHADIDSAVSAVNDGEVFRYLSKPWDDAELLNALREGLARRQLARERDALRELTQRQNAELQVLNAELESRVRIRTAQLEARLTELRRMQARLKEEFSSTVKLLSSLIASRRRAGTPVTQAVTRHVRTLGPALGVTGEALNEVVFAALLHDIGKLAMPDDLVCRPLQTLHPDEQAKVMRHAQVGESMLMGLPSLRGAALVLGQVMENYDGSGVPAGLSGTAIGAGARLLRVATDFECLQSGVLTEPRQTASQAFRRLRQGRGTLYDPAVVDALLLAHDQPVKTGPHKRLLSSDRLQPGMCLAQDLVSSGGVLLLAAGYELDAAKINHIRRIEEFTSDFLWVEVFADGA